MRLGVSVAFACVVAAQPSLAHADEPKKVGEPPVQKEPAEITQTVDISDENAPVDVRLSLGFQQSWRSGKIRRESSVVQNGLTQGGYTSEDMNVAAYTQTISRLNTRAQIGAFEHVALILRMPIILSDNRQLDGLEGSDKQQTTVLAGAPGEQLFRLPFKSPQRSGIEYLAVGIDFGIFNQYRDPSKPTWLFGVEGRFNVAEPMHACGKSVGMNQAGTQQECAHQADINRDGQAGGFNDDGGHSTEGSFSGGRTAGVSRGVTGLEGHTYLSKRIKYIEPYAGFRALFEFPTLASDYGQTDLKGTLVNHPPLQGTMILGLVTYPWEVRDQFQRFSIDFRFAGTYKSEGRDYSELFDALGSSDAPSIRYAQFAEFQRNPTCGPRPVDGTLDPCLTPSTVNPASQKVYFTGLTDVQQHGSYTFSTELTWQAGEYVKFHLGGGYTLVQSHFITFDQPCNPDFSDNVDKSGPCRTESGGPVAANVGVTTIKATGIPNANYRVPINAPGRRFKVDDLAGFDAWIQATVMF